MVDFIKDQVYLLDFQSVMLIVKHVLGAISCKALGQVRVHMTLEPLLLLQLVLFHLLIEALNLRLG